MSSYTFNTIPTIHKRRSFQDLSRVITTSMSVGTLYPIAVREVVPGSTFKEVESHIARLTSSFRRPVMDNYYMDVWFFWTPSRILYDDFVCVFGENKKTAWSSVQEYQNPTYTTRQTVKSGTVADYLGMPLGLQPAGITSLPFRGFAEIYNEWFRNENVIDPMLVQKGSSTVNEQLNSNPWSPANYTGLPPKIAKKKDYFTSALPAPQKGSPVPISTNMDVPLKTTDDYYEVGDLRLGMLDALGDEKAYILTSYDSLNNPSDNGIVEVYDGGNLSTSGVVNATNLVASTSLLSSTNVNDLRLAFQTQRMLELDARAGTRYREYLLAHYGVSNSDARMQIPEYLGGKRCPLDTYQVAQTSSSTTSDKLGSLGAFGYGQGRSGYIKSFSEHGYVYCVAAIRYNHTYQQGLNKMWSRLKRNDYYDPLFAYLGEQPIWTSEIFASSQQSFKDNIFGYQEAWADYRYSPSMITGQARSDADNSLDVYHFADDYTNAPTLSQQFIEETPVYFDRTVDVASSAQDNFIVQFYFKSSGWLPMPVRSNPGLIDHTY
ncbi:major capsid protein [Sigmofec virus UA08Rod_6488]|uniref:Major capsid protein n=1 Tax=Sigmofec virus UA08Rod_6488 TaxID=2929232 RepID=A0A976N1B8_9VIRU|nr:major capsid protein [Sigmofec virus UA08Rod_6488]